jgi:hypothetical protein
MKIKSFYLVFSLLLTMLLLIPLFSGCSNSPPVINSISSGKSEAFPGKTVDITCNATDPDGDELTYIWTASGGTISSQSPYAVWTAPGASGVYTVKVSVRDRKNNEVSDQVFISVVSNQPPVIRSLVVSPSAVGEGQQATVTCDAYDPEGDTVNYAWHVENGEVSGNGPLVKWTLPYDIEQSTIIVTVADGQGKLTSMQTRVTVLPNHNPEINTVNTDSRSMTPGTEVKIRCDADDIDGDQLEYVWEVSGGTVTGSGSEIVWKAPQDCNRYSVKVTVTDGRDGVAMREISMNVAKSGGG